MVITSVVILEYKQILTRSDVKVLLLAGYVDDGRQGTTTINQGYRFSKSDKKFIFSEESLAEDQKLQENGETTNTRMARICLTAMNSINEDLEFTVETEDEFIDKKLPRLDFSIWQEPDGTLNHTYYQKNMKTPFVIMSRSGMARQQQYQILSNELTRRLQNIHPCNGQVKSGRNELLERQ